jgi:hypothetical protein
MIPKKLIIIFPIAKDTQKIKRLGAFQNTLPFCRGQIPLDRESSIYTKRILLVDYEIETILEQRCSR